MARADGVPLYAVETVRMLLAQGRLVARGRGLPASRDPWTSVAVPETLTALVAARLDGLDPADRALVADAAVLGQSFSVPALAAVAGVDEAELAGQAAGPRPAGAAHPRRRPPLARARPVRLRPGPGPRGRLPHALAARPQAPPPRRRPLLRDPRVSEELAGALADHYLAAYRNTPPGPEADALAAQARVALRAAAERATALGSHAQALAFLEQALEITTDPADRAALHASAAAAAGEDLDHAVMSRHAEAAVLERRRTGDREAIAQAIADWADVVNEAHGDPKRALALLTEAWEEFSDLEQTPAGVALMAAMASAHWSSDDNAGATTWNERLLPVAERLGLLRAAANGIMGRGMSLLGTGRPLEGMILLRGAHQLAVTNDLTIEHAARINIAFHEAWGDPASGLALAREGLEIGRRRGSRRSGLWLVPNGCICAMRTGDWDWVASLLEEWLALEFDWIGRAEFLVDRAILRSLRGEDATEDITEATRIRVEGGATQPQSESGELWAGAWAAFAGDRPDEVRRLGEHAATLMSYFAALVCPLLARSALWAGDAPGAASALALLEASGYAGPALAADRVVARAGIDALEGRGPAALAGYREALRSYRKLGLAFDEAAAAVDMAVLLRPPERDAADVGIAIAAARETLERLGARPFLERLDGARSSSRPVTVCAGRAAGDRGARWAPSRGVSSDHDDDRVTGDRPSPHPRPPRPAVHAPDRPGRRGGRAPPRRGSRQHAAAAHHPDLRADRPRERVHVRQQHPVRAGRGAGARRAADGRARVARRDHDQRPGRHRPGDPRQADAGPDRAPDAPHGGGRPERRGASHVSPDDLVLGDLHRARGAATRWSSTDASSTGSAALDESQLTGESDVVRKRPGDEVFSGSFVATGSGRYVAEKVQNASFANLITAGARSFRRVITPLQGEINLVIRVVLGIVLYLEVLLVLRGFVQSAVLGDVVADATLLAGLVPNGLFVSIAVAYALGAIRIIRFGALVQQSNAIESLSHVDVLCLDKTGTLTANRLEVEAVIGARRSERGRGDRGRRRAGRERIRPQPDQRRRSPLAGRPHPAPRRGGAVLVRPEVERVRVRAMRRAARAPGVPGIVAIGAADVPPRRTWPRVLTARRLARRRSASADGPLDRPAASASCSSPRTRTPPRCPTSATTTRTPPSRPACAPSASWPWPTSCAARRPPRCARSWTTGWP